MLTAGSSEARDCAATIAPVEGSRQLERAERLLDDRGRRLGLVRIAAGRSGVAVAFPDDPLLHVSWPALAVACGVLVAIGRRRR
jgi:hypothetical protein